MADKPSLALKAERIKPTSLEVARCWTLIQRALLASYFQDTADIQALLQFLDGHTEYSDYTVEEIAFELMDERVRVSLLDDRADCPVNEMKSVLKQLIS